MAVTLRDIGTEDLEDIIRWRMDKDITKYMNTNPKLTLDVQKKWLAEIQGNTDVRYWLIGVDKMGAGVINLTGLNRPDGEIGWGYYMGERKLRSIKTALSLEMSMYDYVFEKLKKKSVCGDVFSLNKGVIQLHKLCGCEVVEEKKGHVCKEGVWYDVTYMCMTADRWFRIRDEKQYEKIEFA